MNDDQKLHLAMVVSAFLLLLVGVMMLTLGTSLAGIVYFAIGCVLATWLIVMKVKGRKVGFFAILGTPFVWPLTAAAVSVVLIARRRSIRS